MAPKPSSLAGAPGSRERIVATLKWIWKDPEYSTGLDNPAAREYATRMLVAAYREIFLSHYLDALRSGNEEELSGGIWPRPWWALLDLGESSGFAEMLNYCLSKAEALAPPPYYVHDWRQEVAGDAYGALSWYARFPDCRASVLRFAKSSLGKNNSWTSRLVQALGETGDKESIALLNAVEANPDAFINSRQLEWEVMTTPATSPEEQSSLLREDIRRLGVSLKEEAGQALLKIKLANAPVSELQEAILSWRDWRGSIVYLSPHWPTDFAVRTRRKEAIPAIRSRLDEIYREHRINQGAPEFIETPFDKDRDDMDYFLWALHSLDADLSGAERRRAEYWGLGNPRAYLQRTGIQRLIDD